MKSVMTSMLEGKRDLFLVFGMVAIFIVLFTPIPPALLDFLLIINFSLALLILLLTFYTDKPLSFSTFPSLLLIATLFRLALNISATRLILDGADAGNVIHAIGSYVVGGNYVIGLVVFLILVVVQYVVVTNGAQRVAEVAARFTLDSMPGKQMSIDADMNMGVIDEKEAKQRRAMIEKEASFYGAMDGATKFVKGDAIAGILIVLIDIIGGLSVGIAQLGMGWSQALHTYTLLTVGDGIVTQIPSLIIATATGIIITRAATDSHLGDEIAKQILGYPKTLVIVAIALLGLLLLPGLPALPVLLVLAVFSVAAFFALKPKADEAAHEQDQEPEAPKKPAGNESAEDLYDLMRIHPLEIRVGSELASFLEGPGKGFSERLQAFRKQFALEIGFVIPQVRIQQDTRLAATQYSVQMFDTQAAIGSLRLDKILAIRPSSSQADIEGEDTVEPTYGLPAKWIKPEQRQFARTSGYTLVDPETVVLTHFSETIRQNASELLTRSETERLVGRVGENNATLIQELTPGVLSYSEVQKVLQQLLREKVSIRNLEAILEVLVDHGKNNKSPDELTERVRERLGGSICQALSDKDGSVNVLTLAPELERQLLLATRQKDGGGMLFNQPEQVDQFISGLAAQSESMMAQSHLPVLLCPGQLRRQLRNLVQRALPHITVIGLNEIPTNARIRSFGIIKLELKNEAALS